jgi:hypothetical protein
MTIAGTGYVGIAKETTFGTAVAATAFLPVESAEATTDPQNYYPEQIKGTRSKSQGVPMGRKNELSLAQDAEPSTLGHWLLAALGKVDTTAGGTTGTYNHVFTPANTLPSYTVEKYDGVMTQQIAGSKCDSMTLSVEAGGDGVFKIEADFLAQSISDKEAQATPSYTDKAPFTFYQVSAQKGGVETTDVKNFEIEVSNNLKDDKYVLRKSRDVKDIPEGMREVTFSGEMYFVNKAAFIDFMDGKSESLKFTVDTVGGDQLVIDLPKIMYDGYEIPMGGADDEIMASIEGTALYDPETGGEIKMTLLNTTASY